MHIGEDTLFFFTYLLHISQLYISNRLDYNYSYDVDSLLEIEDIIINLEKL